MDEDQWARTVESALQTGAITAEPDVGAYRIDVVIAAIQALTRDMPNLDAIREGWVSLKIEVREGGR